MEEFHNPDESDPYSHSRDLAIIRSEVRALGRRFDDYLEDVLAPAARQFVATRDAADRTILRRLDELERLLGASLSSPAVAVDDAEAEGVYAAGYVDGVRARATRQKLRLVASPEGPRSHR